MATICDEHTGDEPAKETEAILGALPVSDAEKTDQSATLVTDKLLAVETSKSGPDIQEDSSHTVHDRLFRTACVFGAFLAMGWVNTLLGASLVDIEIIFGVDTKNVSIVFLTYNVGYVIGCVILGFLYERLSAELQLAVGMLVFSMAASVGLFTGNLAGFSALMALKGIGMGYVDSAAQPYTLNLWKDHRFRNPVMHMCHCVYSLGSFTAPLILKSFLLPDLPIEGTSPNGNTTLLNVSIVHFQPRLDFSNVSWVVSNSTKMAMTITAKESYAIEDFNQSATIAQGAAVYTQNQMLLVKYGFLTLSSLCLPVIVAFLIAFIRGERKVVLELIKDVKDDDKVSKQRSRDTKTLLCLIFFLLVFYEITEDTSGGFVATYVIKGLHWVKHKGPLVTSVLWGAGFGGHLLSIPISYFLTPTQMVIIGSCFITTSFSVIFIAVFISVSEIVIWISVAFAGIGFSSYLGSVILWSANFMDVGGVASSVFLLATSIGAIFGPWLVGVLFDTYTPHAFVYVVLGCSVIVILMFMITNVYVRKCSLWKPKNTTSEGGDNSQQMQCLKEDTLPDNKCLSNINV